MSLFPYPLEVVIEKGTALPEKSNVNTASCGAQVAYAQLMSAISTFRTMPLGQKRRYRTLTLWIIFFMQIEFSFSPIDFS